MNLLLKILLMRRSRDRNRCSVKSDRGFAIPIVLALGLIMVVLSIASIYKSSDQNISATTQRGTSKALAAAEAGVAYYMAFLNRNSAIASYSSAGWTNANLAPLATCDTAGNIINLANNPRSAGTDGSYQLVSYQYFDNTGLIPSGTVPNNNTYAELTVLGTGSFSGNSFASTRVKVQIPVRQENIGASYPGVISPFASYALNPVLWIRSYDNTNTNLGNLKIASYQGQATNFPYGGNIVLSGLTGTDICKLPADADAPTPTNNLQDPNRQYIVADRRDMPNIAEIPPLDFIGNTLTSNLNSYTSISNSTDIVGKTLPYTGSSNKDAIVSYGGATYYYYSYTGGNLTLDNASFTTTNGSKVVLFLNGDLTLKGNAGINPTSDTGTTVAKSSQYLEIYGGPNTQNINLEGNGTINVRAFIHAPNATVKVKVSDNPTLSFTGAMWVKNWENGDLLTNTSRIYPDVGDKDGIDYQSTVLYTTSSYGTYMRSRPIISPPTRWETMEAN